MAGVELGAYYVSVTPSARGITSGLQDELAGVSGEVKGISGNLAKVGASLAVAKLGRDAVTAGGALQKSQQTLAGLYEDGELAAATMADIKDIASNSSLSLASYQSAATGLAYIGIQGEQAARVLENVGKAIVGAGGDSAKLEQATNALTKMQSAGRVTLDSIQQLSASGVPILSALEAHFGVTREQVNKMATEGKIGIEDVTTALEQGLGEWFPKQIAAADELEKGFSASWARMSDSAKVALGEAVLPLLEAVTPGLQAMATALGLIPSPLLTVGAGLAAAAAASSLLQGAIARNTLGLGTLTGALARNATSAGIASAASAGLAGALTREAEAAGVAAAAHGGLSGARGRGAIAGRLGAGLGKLSTRLTIVAGGLWAVGEAGGWLGDKLHGSRPEVDEMTDALIRLGETGEQTGAMLDEHGSLDDLTESIKRFKANSDGVDGVINKTTDVLAKVGTLGFYSGHSTFDQLTKDINLFDEGLAQMVQSGNVDEAKAAFREIESHLLAEGLSGDDVTRFFNDYLDAADKVPPANEEIGTSAEGAAGGLGSLGETAEEAAENWEKWVEENGAVAALQNTHAEAESLKSILDEIAGSMAKALGIHLSPAMASDAQAQAQQAFNEALADAAENGYTGDFLNLADKSKDAMNLRDKYWALQDANAQLGESWLQAEADGLSVAAMLRGLGDEFEDTSGVFAGKAAIDSYRESIEFLIGSLGDATAAWKEAEEAARSDAASSLTFNADGSLQAPPGTWSPAEWQSMFPGRAKGGPVSAGELYRVNELGMEFFQPSVDGTVIPLGKGPSGSDRPIIVNVYNPTREPSSTSIPRAGRQLAAAIGGS